MITGYFNNEQNNNNKEIEGMDNTLRQSNQNDIYKTVHSTRKYTVFSRVLFKEHCPGDKTHHKN